MTKFTFNQKLAALALTLAILSLIAGLAFPNGPKRLSQEPRFISIMSLAEQIKNREPLVLIDLRSPELYDEFHLPTAVSQPLAGFDWQGMDESVSYVFYSGDDLLARTLWVTLPATAKAHSFILFGGAYDWFDRLLYPKLPLAADGEEAEMAERVDALCRFYGGQAEFVNDTIVIEYYFTEVSEASWPRVARQGKLMRRGC